MIKTPTEKTKKLSDKKALSLIEQTEAMTEQVEEENNKLEQELERKQRELTQLEEERARDMIGGDAEFYPEEVKTSLSPKDYKDEVLAGRIPPR